MPYSIMVDEWVRMFKLYPEVFPKGYYRFLATNLRVSLINGTYIYRDGVLLTFKRYKRANGFALAGDYLLDKMVSVSPGSTHASSVMNEFKGIIASSRCYLKVAQLNVRAISFYQRNGFTTVQDARSYLIMATSNLNCPISI